MVIGDNVTLFIPHEARARTLWNLQDIQSKHVLPKFGIQKQDQKQFKVRFEKRNLERMKL